MDFLCLVFNIKSGFPLIGFKYSVDFYCRKFRKDSPCQDLKFYMDVNGQDYKSSVDLPCSKF